MDLFFELIQISLGNKETFDRMPSDKEWQALLDLANKQSLASLLFMELEKVLEQPGVNKPSVLYEWIGVHQTTATLNKHQNKRAKELTEIFSKQGFTLVC